MDQMQSHENIDFIVHNYANSKTSLPPTASILNAGRHAIESASRTGGWASVNWKIDATGFDTRGQVFRFAPAAPIHLGPKTNTTHSLKEWGSPIDLAGGDELLGIEGLEDFESTNLEYLVSFAPISSHPHDEHKMTKPTPTPESFDRDLGQPPATKRRLDFEPLHDIIPQPHFHPSTSNECPPVDIGIYPYKKARPIPIAPHDLGTIKEYLKTPYARAAWVIPIRGALHWKGSTPAKLIILDSLASQTPTTYALEPDNHIKWTDLSMKAFWDFLLRIRIANTLGPIALSFHAAPTYSIQSQVRTSTSSHDHKRNMSTANNNIGRITPDNLTSKSSTPQVSGMPLQAVDHFKVYHEASYSRHLRNILDAWPYPSPVNESAVDHVQPAASVIEQQKIRPLLGARLVLVDESSHGVFLL